MKYIVKNYPEPATFTAWKQRKKLTKNDLLRKTRLQKEQGEIWKTFTKSKEKNNLKESLLNEQGFLCCYCQQQLHLNENTQIEHLAPRGVDALKMLDYDNLLAACNGGQPEREQYNRDNTIDYQPKYCGHAKANYILAITPLDKDCETHFYYEIQDDTGSILDVKVWIRSSSTEGKDAIDKLNLNTPKLLALRGQAIAAWIYDEQQIYISPQEAQQILTQINHTNHKPFVPFCAVLQSILQWLSQ